MWRLWREVSASTIIAIASLLFVIGVSAAPYVQTSPWIGLLGILLCCCLFWRRVIACIPFVCAGAFLIGIGYGTAAMGDRMAYSVYMNQVVVVKGRVREDPSRTASGQTALQLDSVVIDNARMPGAVFATVTSGAIKRGDVVKLRSVLRPGFGSFPASLRRAEVTNIVREEYGDVGRVVRDWFADTVRKAVDEPQASLGIGFLTGQKSALPKDLTEALQIAGLTHIVVASGYNLTILVQAARRLFVKTSKFMAAVSAGAMIVGFIAITGLSPSMTRAGLVSGMSLLAWYYGHRFHPLVLLPFAAAITVGIQPSYVWGDLGWQLSFAAFAGVMIVAPLLQRYFFGEKAPGMFRQILGETIAAHVMTIPLIVLSFGTVSNIAIIANLLVVPLVPLAMLLTAISGLAALLFMPAAIVIGTVTTWLLTYMTTVTYFLAGQSWAQVEVSFEWWVWLLYYLGIGLACFLMWRTTKLRFREVKGLEAY